LHDHDDRRVAAEGRHHLGRDRRREGSPDAEPRRRVDRSHAGADGGRRARGPLGQPRVRLPARHGHRVRVEDRLPQRRLRALSVYDDRQRQDVDLDQGMNYHLFGDKYIEVPNEPEALVINYYLKADAPAPAKITVKDPSGKVLRESEGPAKAGLNRALVSLSGGGGRGGRPSTGSGQ